MVAWLEAFRDSHKGHLQNISLMTPNLADSALVIHCFNNWLQFGVGSSKGILYNT